MFTEYSIQQLQKDVKEKFDLDKINSVITSGDKLIYAGFWKHGFHSRIESLANQLGKPIDVRSPHGSLMFSVAPECEVE